MSSGTHAQIIIEYSQCALIAGWQASVCLDMLFPSHSRLISCSDGKIAYFTGASIMGAETHYLYTPDGNHPPTGQGFSKHLTFNKYNKFSKKCLPETNYRVCKAVFVPADWCLTLLTHFCSYQNQVNFK